MSEYEPEFIPESVWLNWMREHLAGWQFGEQGLIPAVLNAIGADGHCIEYGAGDGESLPVTIDRVTPRNPWRRVLVEIDSEKCERLNARYPKDIVTKWFDWNRYVTERIACVVIDIDGKDSVVLRQMLGAGVFPDLIVCEHMDLDFPITTTNPASIPEWLLGQELPGKFRIQDTAETLHAIAGKYGYERIGLNRCNSFFVKSIHYQGLFR